MKLEMKYQNEPHEIADLGHFCLLEKGSSTRFSVNAQSKFGVVVLGTREAGVFAHKHTSHHTCCYPRVPRVMESEMPPSVRCSGSLRPSENRGVPDSALGALQSQGSCFLFPV